MHPRTWLAAALVLVLAACGSSQKRSGKSPEEQLVETRQELRDTIDRLFTTYGGSEITGGSGGGGAGGTAGGVLGHVVGEADRSLFERQCLATGRGERPVAVSPKLREFLDRAEVAKECRRAAELERRVTELEREVAGGR